MPCNGSSSPWAKLDPRPFRQGWDAAIAGKPRESCDFFGGGPRAAWNAGYDDALAEREKDAPADPLPGNQP